MKNEKLVDERLLPEWEGLREKQTASQTIFDGVILHVRKDGVELPNGHFSGREYIQHVGAVAVVPLTEDGRIIVERQYRYPVDRVITEIPAGKLDSRSEDPLLAAKRELREETGLTADTWTELGPFYSAAAYSDEKIMLYLATGLHQGQQDLDDDEFLNVLSVPIEDVVDEIMAGHIADSKTQTAVLRVARMIGK